MARRHRHALRAAVLAAAATGTWWYATQPASAATAAWGTLGWLLLAAELGAWLAVRMIIFFTGPAWWCALVTANQRARWRNWRKHGFPWPLRWVYRVKGRPHIPDRLRRWVYHADGYACVACSYVQHTACWCGQSHSNQFEHVRPFSRGGKTSAHNGVTLCPHCNVIKSDYWVYKRRGGRRSRAYYHGFAGSESAAQAAAILAAGQRAQRSPARLARLMAAALAG